MKFKRKDVLPVEAVIPALERWIKDHDSYHEAGNRMGTEKIRDLGGRVVLSHMAGIGLRSLTRILNREQENISFKMADKLFCAMEKQDLWYSDPTLHYWYTEGLDLRTPEEYVRSEGRSYKHRALVTA